MEFLKYLNEQQLKAVKQIKGPCLVLAGAGSGKTRTLTYRIAYLLANKIQPQNILAVTFTNKAANEMKQRILNLTLKHLPFVGTFHSISARILRKEIYKIGYKRNFVIYDENDKLKAINNTLEILNLSKKQYQPAKISWYISNFKNNLILPKQAEAYIDNIFTEKVVKIYSEYEKFLKKINALDFDDLILKIILIWETFPKVLEKYQNLWKYILIDEYQDINQAQYKWSKLLAEKHKNIFVVGDDAQAIYGFRGADFTNILNFENDYKSAKVFILDRNYRSSQEILNLGNYIISQNKNQKQKNLWTNFKSGVLPKIVEVENEILEALYIIKDIFNLPKYIFEDYINETINFNIIDKISNEVKTKSLDKIAVLYRTNSQSRALEEVFLKFGVLYKIYGGIGFYERKEIKDIIAFLKFLINPNDIVSLKRVLEFMGYGIGEKTLNKIIKTSKKYKNLLDAMKDSDNSKVKNFLQKFNLVLSKIYTLDITKVIELIIKISDYNIYLVENFENFEERIENLNELKTVSKRYKNLKGKQAISKFVEEVSLLSGIDKYRTKSKGVNFMTLHLAKGLEFEKVFIVGVEEGLLPHINSQNTENEIEEERRLFYVGITRAKKFLNIIYTRKRTIYGKSFYAIPSRFIEEIPKHLYEFERC